MEKLLPGMPGAVREEFVYDQRGGRAEQGKRGKRRVKVAGMVQDSCGKWVKKPVPGMAPITTTHENSKRILSFFYILPVAKTETYRIRPLVQTFQEHTFSGIGTVKFQPSHL